MQLEKRLPNYIGQKRGKDKMKNESRLREIEKCKEILKKPELGYNQRASLKFYLKSLEDENGYRNN